MKIFTPQPRLYPYCALVQPKRNFSLSEKYTEFWVQLPFNSHLVSLSFYLGTTWNHWSSSSCRLTYCSLPSLHCRVSPAGAQCGSWLEGRSQDGFGLLRPTRLSGQTEGEDSSSETVKKDSLLVSSPDTGSDSHRGRTLAVRSGLGSVVAEVVGRWRDSW